MERGRDIQCRFSRCSAKLRPRRAGVSPACATDKAKIAGGTPALQKREVKEDAQIICFILLHHNPGAGIR